MFANFQPVFRAAEAEQPGGQEVAGPAKGAGGRGLPARGQPGKGKRGAARSGSFATDHGAV